jgi:hypothetical protein
LAVKEQLDPERVVSTNVVHYERRAGQPLELSGASTTSEVVFIDENTPEPPLPKPRAHVPFHRRPGNDDGVIYIGPE